MIRCAHDMLVPQGKGSGKINLEMTYRSHESFLPHEPKDAELGVLIVTVRQGGGRKERVRGRH